MTEDCESKTLHHNGKLFNGRTGADGDYGIQITLLAVNAAGSARIEVDFRQDWLEATIPIIQLASGGDLTYTDPEGVQWKIYLDSSEYNSAEPEFSSADMRVCYDAPEPAEGQIISTDIPASASGGDVLETYTTIKNIGGTRAKFFLRFYDGATLVHEGLPGWIEPGQTIVDNLENPTMPDHTWNGRIDLMRQE